MGAAPDEPGDAALVSRVASRRLPSEQQTLVDRTKSITWAILDALLRPLTIPEAASEDEDDGDGPGGGGGGGPGGTCSEVSESAQGDGSRKKKKRKKNKKRPRVVRSSGKRSAPTAMGSRLRCR